MTEWLSQNSLLSSVMLCEVRIEMEFIGRIVKRVFKIAVSTPRCQLLPLAVKIKFLGTDFWTKSGSLNIVHARMMAHPLWPSIRVLRSCSVPCSS